MNGIVVARMGYGVGVEEYIYKQYLLLMSTPYIYASVPRGGHVQERHEDAGASHFDRSFINRIIKRELKHIPRGDKGSLQNILRFSYNILRRKHLTQRKSRHETLKELVERMQRIHPDFTPIYDKEIFKI